MAGERVKLQVLERESRGTAETRRLRKQGLIPGVLYGGGKEPKAICVEERELRRVLTGDAGLHAILDVTLDGQNTSRPSILKTYQQDPVKGTLTHIDLQEVRLDQAIQARVVVELIGEPVGVTEGGVLSQVNREITVEALPLEVPEHLDLDVTGMAIGDTLRLVDLPFQEGVKFLDAGPARRGARQSRARVRAHAPQRRLDGARRGCAPAWRLVALQVLRLAVGGAARGSPARAAET